MLSINNFVNVVSFQMKTVFKAARPCFASFHTTAIRDKQKPNKTYKDLPQPILRPIGPEDYNRWKYFLNQPKTSPFIQSVTSKDEITNDVVSRVNEQIDNGTHGRLFAVVEVCSKQFKVTNEDIIVVQGYFEPEIGANIKLEKVLLVGSSDFTLIGRPLLEKHLVHVEATVIEKTFSQIITHFVMIPRKRHRRTNFHRIPLTMLRINNIAFKGQVN